MANNIELDTFPSQPGEPARDAAIPMLLVAELTVTDPDAMMRHASEVQPLMARYGGPSIPVPL